MIVEELVVQVDRSDVESFLDADARVWTTFLSRQPGFVRKEVWLPADRPGTVEIMVWWETRELWKSITDAQVAAVDREMGEWYREPAVREHAVVR
jgi:uncharacterized protein (TIGR03792 family)